ncbi:MAG: DUF6502 family protein [Cellvibrionaceae bacterium]
MKKTTMLKTIILRLLKPIVHLLIKNEISHSEFSEIARKAYVEVAHRDFALPNRKSTTSRVAVLTGLSRKEVVRLSEDKESLSKPKINHNRAARVITGWLNDKEFQAANGTAKRLPLKGNNSFATLVERYSGDITSGAIIDELTRIGVVSVEDKTHIRLEKSGYIPDKDEIEQINILSNCAENLFSTGLFNINKTEKEDSRFQRQLTHRDVNREIADKFAELCHTKSLTLLLELDDWLKQQKATTNSDAKETKTRIGLGIYHFED